MVEDTGFFKIDLTVFLSRRMPYPVFDEMTIGSFSSRSFEIDSIDCWPVLSSYLVRTTSTFD